MKLQLKNPIVFFDLETTGTNFVTDRIVEISYHKVSPNGREETKTIRVNPGMPIPKGASEIHGVYDADVADCPTFKSVAKEDVQPMPTNGGRSSEPENGISILEFVNELAMVEPDVARYIYDALLWHGCSLLP